MKKIFLILALGTVSLFANIDVKESECKMLLKEIDTSINFLDEANTLQSVRKYAKNIYYKSYMYKYKCCNDDECRSDLEKLHDMADEILIQYK